MPTINLTKRTVEALSHPEAGQTLFRDENLAGFGLRVGSRSKVFFVEGQVRRRTVRVTIGRADVLSPEIARQRAKAILGEMAEGKDPNRTKRAQVEQTVTLRQAFEQFFRAKPHLSKTTVEGYGRTLRVYLRQWAPLPLWQITRHMVLRKHQSVAEEHGPVTANNVMRHLRSVYNWASATQEDVPPNPVLVLTQARAWTKERRRRTVVAQHDLPAWWRAVMAEPPHSRDFLLVALFTGMRRSEIAQLKWENLELIGGTLHLPKTKNGDPLDLPLSPFIRKVIADRRELVGQSEWVFPGAGASGHMVESKTILRRVVGASGVKFTLHDLRRTFITIAESLDIPAYALKRLLNHRADTDVTGGYIVINPERLRQPVERVAAKILELADGERKCRGLGHQ
jgi:integrase